MSERLLVLVRHGQSEWNLKNLFTGWKDPDLTELGVKEATKVQPREVKAILAKLTRERLAVHTGELWFWRTSFDDLRTRVVAHLDRAPRLTIADFKEMSGMGRKQSIVLLEQLDREGVTRRDGDDRVRAG